MYIARGIRAARWQALNLDDVESSDWDEAVDIFDKRIRARYLEPVEVLIELDAKRAVHLRVFGFTILAIDCLLVETLQAFRLGLKDTRDRSGDMFRRFLTERPRFREHFDKKSARRFYEDVRCGILHQAEVRRGWRVWSVGRLLAPTDGGFTINRTKFHECLVGEFEDYKAEVRSAGSPELRQHLRKKMDHICSTG